MLNENMTQTMHKINELNRFASWFFIIDELNTNNCINITGVIKTRNDSIIAKIITLKNHLNCEYNNQILKYSLKIHSTNEATIKLLIWENVYKKIEV